jgi:hypothetical protein
VHNPARRRLGKHAILEHIEVRAPIAMGCQLRGSARLGVVRVATRAAVVSLTVYRVFPNKRSRAC